MYLIYEKFKFLTELLLACSFLPFYLERRSRFGWRVLAFLAALYGVAWLTPLAWSTFFNVLRYPWFLLLIMVGIKFCFQATNWEVLFCGVAGYTVQHISFSIWALASLLFPDAFTHLGVFTTGRLLLELVTYLPFFYLFSRWLRSRNSLQVDRHVLVVTSLVILSAAIVLNYIRTIYSSSFSTVASAVCIIYSIGACVLSMVVQFSLLEQSKIQREREIFEQLWHREQEQYKISQENIHLINIKCHDLKHQLRALEQGAGDSKFLREAEKVISIYDSAIRTENDALDVILTEKSLLCEQNQIKLTCMVDGHSFAFMDLSDLYSIFGNIFDNAVEAVLRLGEVEKRIICITGTQTGGFVTIRVENFFDQKLGFQDGLPVTTKPDKAYHGFGLRSVRHLVNKYNGEMTLSAENGLFVVNIMIPMPT